LETRPDIKGFIVLALLGVHSWHY